MQQGFDFGAPPPVSISQRRTPLLVAEVSGLVQAGIHPGSYQYQLSEQLLAWVRRVDGFAVLALWHDDNWCWLYDYGRRYRTVPPGLAEAAYLASRDDACHFYPMEGHPCSSPHSPP